MCTFVWSILDPLDNQGSQQQRNWSKAQGGFRLLCNPVLRTTEQTQDKRADINPDEGQ